MKRRDFIAKSGLGAASTLLVPAVGNASTLKEKSIKPVQGITATTQNERKGIIETAISTDKCRSGIALGGIGAGGAELRKDGIFYNWSIANNNPKGTGNFLLGEDFNRNRLLQKTDSFYPFQNDYILFFIVRYQVEGENPKIKLLQIEDGYKVAGMDMHVYEFPWMQGIEKIEFSGSFPFVELNYKDSELPFGIKLNAWSPFIPHDVKNSSLPLLNFDFEIISKTEKPVDVMITANYRSLVGYDVYEKLWDSDLVKTKEYVAQISKIQTAEKEGSSVGEMGLIAFDSNASYHCGWGHRHQYHEWLLLHTELKNEDNTVTSRNTKRNTLNKLNGSPENYNALAISRKLKSEEKMEAKFSMVWFFPNLYDESLKNIIGHYYHNFFQNSLDVVKYLAKNRLSLHQRSKTFLDAFYDNTAPTFLTDLVNAQFTTFITSAILAKNKDFGILEGITQHQSWGPVGTTDVNMYGGVMVSALFPDLAKSTMRVHKILQLQSGEIRHSFKKGFAEALIGVAGVTERLDLHSQYAIMALRDYFLTDDLNYLKEMWPSVKKALDYTLYKRDINGDQQPDMTGIMCSYDNFPMYGMASYVHSQWLAALAGALQAAQVLGDKAFMNTYQSVFLKGKKLAEEKLWNGEYFRLYHSDLKTMATKDGAGKEIIKDMQGVDEACLTDQLIGQWAARWSNWGDLFKDEHVKKALQSIVKMSYKPNFGLRNCSWPGFDFYKPVTDDTWVDQGNTVWSGVELSFVSFLLYEGLYADALKVAQTVHERYLKAGRYWDHQEFGGHYFRAMGVYGIVNGLAGLSINQGHYIFAPVLPQKNFKLFFSFAGGYGHIEKSNAEYNIHILSGQFIAKSITLKNVQNIHKAYVQSQKVAEIKEYLNEAKFSFKKNIILTAGEKMVLR